MPTRRRMAAAPLLIPLALAIIGCAGIFPASTPTPSPAPRWSGPTLTTAPMSAADAAVVDADVQAKMAEVPDLPGVWIGIWSPDKGYYMQAYGSAVVGGDQAALDQHGRIGSVTKTFTVTAVLEQVAAGKLSLDSTIADELPDLAAKYPSIADVTVSQLAGMQTPIQDYANTGVAIAVVLQDPSHVFTADELIDAGMSLPLLSPDKYGYSTTNTIILGKMLEKVTGQPVEQAVTAVATELGMSNTALQAASVTAMPAPASRGYIESMGVLSLAQIGLTVEAGTDVSDWSPSWGQAGGGMYSTIADLGKWAQSGLGSSLLPVELANQRFEAHTIPEGNYGLGVFVWGSGWIGHTGQLIGWESIVAYNRDTGAAFVALVNETGSLSVPVNVGLGLFPDMLGS